MSTGHHPIRLLAMGGTIAFDEGTGGALPRLGGAQLARSVAGTAGVEVVDLASSSSIALQDAHLVTLAEAIRDAAGDGCRGVVVSHGTDTLEESCYFAALTCADLGLPVVFTAAMRHHGQPGADGPANLRDALAVAALPEAAAAGPLVVMNGEIHAARFVAKLHGTSTSAFASPLAGPIGQVVEDVASLWFSPAYRDALGVVERAPLPRVELVPVALGSGPDAALAIVGTAPAGIVVDGLGGGHVPPAALPAIDLALERGIPVVVGSRCGSGPTLLGTYGIPGGELDLQQRGALMAGALSSPKARLRLAVALHLGLPPTAAFPVA